MDPTRNNHLHINYLRFLDNLISFLLMVSFLSISSTCRSALLKIDFNFFFFSHKPTDKLYLNNLTENMIVKKKTQQRQQAVVK